MSNSLTHRGNGLQPSFRVATNLLAALLCCTVATGTLLMGIFSHIRSGLDPSWAAAVAEAPARGEVFGRDLIFTGGPLSAAYTQYFSLTTWWWVILFQAAAVGLLFVAVLVLRPGLLGGIALAAALLVSNRDAMLLALPLLAALASLQPLRFGRFILVLGAVVSAAAALAKFSVFPIAVATMFLADCVFVARRRIPVGFPAFLLGFGVLLSLLNGGPASIPDFLRYSFATSTGYVGAMSSTGSRLEMIAYLVLAAVLLAVIVWTMVIRSSSYTVQAAAVVLCLSIYLFFTFKLGFVRHDLHSTTAWYGLSIVAALTLGLAGWTSRAWLKLALGAFVLTAGLTGHVLVSFAVNLSMGLLLRSDVNQVATSFDSLWQIASSRSDWLAQQMAEQETSQVALRKTDPLPPLNGTVDIIPSRQASVIANGLDYRPRFTVQEYTSYTPSLIDANRAFFHSSRAPAYLLFGTDSVDGRSPAMTEGALWPDFMSLYQPDRNVRDLLLLRRRPQPLDALLGPAVALRGRLGEPVELGTPRAFLRVKVEENVLGKLMSLVWRPPLLRLRLIFANGTERIFRFVPGQGEAGFIASPFMASSGDFLTLWAGTGDAGSLSTVRAVAIETSSLGGFAYRTEFTASVQAIDLAPVVAADASNLLLTERRKKLERVVLLTRHVVPTPPQLDFAPEGLFAHAPSRINVPASGASLTVGFGIRPSGGTKQANGVCFRVLGENGAALWERCLDPGHKEDDAGVQAATFDLPEGTKSLTFVTDCRADCSYDWSYWSEAYIQPEQ